MTTRLVPKLRSSSVLASLLLVSLLLVVVPGFYANGNEQAATGSSQPALDRLVQFAGKFHPVVVHFPIALAMAAALAEMLALFRPSAFFSNAARYSIVLAAISAVGTVALGWAAGAFAQYPSGYAWVLATHRWLGTAAGILIVSAAVLSELSHRKGGSRYRALYRVALFMGALVVGVAGHFGASLIYGLDYFTG